MHKCECLQSVNKMLNTWLHASIWASTNRMKMLPPKISVGIRVLSRRLQWMGREADRSPLSIGKVKN